MLTNLRKILDLLSHDERRRAYLLLAMVLVMALLDTIGVGLVLPFVSVLSDPDIVVSNRYLAAIYHRLGFSDTHSFLRFLGIVVFVALIASIAFRALTTYALLRFTHMRSYSLSRQLVAGYLRQPYEWFLDRHSADLGKTVLSEVNQVITGALIPMVQLVAHGMVVISLVVLLIVVNPFWAVALTAGFGGVYGVVYWLLRRYLSRIGLDRVNANRERFQILQETFGGIKEVKVSGLEESLIHRFDNPSRRFARRQAASQVANQLPRFALEALAFGGMLLVALYLMAVPGNLQRAMPVLALYALAGYRLLPASQQVYLQLANLRFAGPALSRLHADLIQLKHDDGAHFSNQPESRMQLSKMLAMDDVFYSYPTSDRPVLNGLTLKIPARTTVGFVGATGSGKTTTVDMILGLLRPQKGQISADGTVITADNIRTWQRTIGYVPQTIYLADDTIAANIAFGQTQQEIDLAAVERAARIANLHTFVTQESDKGYSTVVGERGVRLSGGQRQRIGIARALYHDPEVLILDEATSALDNITEQAVMEAVHNLGQRKTIIIIAHRLSTVRRCDRIFVLEQGRVVESGTFESLVKHNSRFRSMSETEVNHQDAQTGGLPGP